MKIKYKIVWLDDQPEKMKLHIGKIESILSKNFFIPDIQKPYTSYEDFHRSFNGTTAGDIYGEVFNDCDLLLIDYHIAEKQENEQKTGATIISDLRSKGIYTETVFYSNAMDNYRNVPDKEELDNVIYADKSELINKVEHIIKKSVVQSMIISNLRGYLMDSTSDFDFMCRTISEYYFEQLNDDQQLEILQEVEKFIHQQYKSGNNNLGKINSKYKDKDLVNIIKKLENINTFKGITERAKRTKIFRDVFNSQQGVITVSNKFKLMARVLQKNNVEGYSEICSLDNNVQNENNSENEKYFNMIIKHRNKLAHNKLIYGSTCKNRIKIIKAIEDLACNCENNECEKSYSYDVCKELRKNIYNYYNLFNPLFEDVLSKKSGMGLNDD